MNTLWGIIGSLLLGWQTGDTGVDQENFIPYLRFFRVPLQEGRGPQTTPTETDMDPITAQCFDADNEELRFLWQVPNGWDESSDWYIYLIWTNEGGDPLENGETVIWFLDWRSVDHASSETYDNGSEVSASDTYTESGNPGTDKDLHLNIITIDHDHGDQVIDVEDCLIGIVRRDMTNDTATEAACLLGAKLGYYSDKLPEK